MRLQLQLMARELGTNLIRPFKPSFRAFILSFRVKRGISILALLFLCSCSSGPLENEKQIKLGYLLNMTHAVPIVGIESGIFEDLESYHFLSGGYLLNALMTGQVNVAYIGPGPYINAISKGVDLDLLDFASSAANSLIVSEEFDPQKPYVIKKIAVPQLGNTQDLLAKMLLSRMKKHQKHTKTMLAEIQQLAGSKEGIQLAGDIDFLPIAPPEIEMAFYTGGIDAALVTEPWGTILEAKGLNNISAMLEAGPVSLVDELEGIVDTTMRNELRHINKYPAALLVVKRDFYKNNKKLVEEFAIAQEVVKEFIQEEKEKAVWVIKDHLEKKIKSHFAPEFLLASFNKVEFSQEPDSKWLEELAAVSVSAKYIR